MDIYINGFFEYYFDAIINLVVDYAVRISKILTNCKGTKHIKKLLFPLTGFRQYN